MQNDSRGVSAVRVVHSDSITDIHRSEGNHGWIDAAVPEQLHPFSQAAQAPGQGLGLPLTLRHPRAAFSRLCCVARAGGIAERSHVGESDGERQLIERRR